jgi:hypothetical protein
MRLVGRAAALVASVGTAIYRALGHEVVEVVGPVSVSGEVTIAWLCPSL